MPASKLTAALKKLRAAREALKKEQKRLTHGGTKKDKALIVRLLRKLDSTEGQLVSIQRKPRSEKITHRAPPKARGKKGKRSTAVSRKRVGTPPKALREPQLIGTRELAIRGFWDRYPKDEQKRRPKRFKQFPAALRRGPTAFDLLLRDYLSFTVSQRRRLQIRVAYGIIHETGRIIGPADVDNMGLVIDLSMNREQAISALRTILTRAGLIYTPIGWENEGEDASVPLGIEWWLV